MQFHVNAYWTNERGEEMSARVHAEFWRGETFYLVVHDWREGTSNQGFIAKPVREFNAVRLESL